MFLCVWLYFKKIFEKYFLVFGKCYKEKTNLENTDKTQIDARYLTGFDGTVLRELQFDDRAVDHDLAKHRVASRDRDRRRDLAKARSQSRIAIDGAGASERRGLELGACEWRGLMRACLPLSLSLSGIHLK